MRMKIHVLTIDSSVQGHPESCGDDNRETTVRDEGHLEENETRN